MVFVGCFGGEPAIYGEVMREFVERNLRGLVDDVYFVIGNSVPAGTEEWKVRRERTGSKSTKTLWVIFYNWRPSTVGF